MKTTLQKLLVQCLQESKKELGNYKIEKYPSQVAVNLTIKIKHVLFNFLFSDLVFSRKYCFH